jgi:hypothetical protein
LGPRVFKESRAYRASKESKDSKESRVYRASRAYKESKVTKAYPLRIMPIQSDP